MGEDSGEYLKERHTTQQQPHSPQLGFKMGGGLNLSLLESWRGDLVTWNMLLNYDSFSSRVTGGSDSRLNFFQHGFSIAEESDIILVEESLE